MSKTANDFIKTKGLVILNFVGEDLVDTRITDYMQEYTDQQTAALQQEVERLKAKVNKLKPLLNEILINVEAEAISLTDKFVKDIKKAIK